MGKKKSTFKNIMVTLGCAAFASVYVLGGGYVISTFLMEDGSARPAWLQRVEIRVAENASDNAIAGRSAISTAVAEISGAESIENAASAPEGQSFDSSVNDNGNHDDFNSGDAAQKPRFEEKEKETETETEPESNTELETETQTESESNTELETETKMETETATESEAMSETESELESETETEIGTETESETDTEPVGKSVEKKDSRKTEEERKPVEARRVQVLQQDAQALSGVSDVTAVVKTAMPCVVAITNEYTSYDYWYDEEYDELMYGSGIVVAQSDEELLIVTSYHVIEDTNNLYVQFIDDEEATAYVKGVSLENDLAIVSVFLEDISDDTLQSIAIAALGDSDSLQVGEPAIAIGNSMGYGQSVTTGVISALNRNMFADEPDMNQVYLIQTDAAINPGNSGGALLNAKGEVIGINSGKIVNYTYTIEGMGYAIPISTAKPIIENLMQKETKKKVSEEERGFLGIAGTDVIEEATARYEMPEGVYVSDVVENTAADKAGIKKGDIIVYIDGEKIRRMDQLQGMLEYYAAGTEVEVILMRQSNGEYRERTVSVTLGHRE